MPDLVDIDVAASGLQRLALLDLPLHKTLDWLSAPDNLIQDVPVGTFGAALPNSNANSNVIDRGAAEPNKEQEQLVSPLRYLDLRRNQITFLASEVFRELPKLEVLLLQGNKLTSLGFPSAQVPGAGAAAPPPPLETALDTYSMFDAARCNLRRVEISNNHVSLLAPALFNRMDMLDVFTAGHNRLQTLPPTLFKGSSALRFLAVPANGLTELSIPFQDIQSLEVLVADNNQLSALPAGVFRNNSKLRSLQLDNNNIRIVEDGAFPISWQAASLRPHSWDSARAAAAAELFMEGNPTVCRQGWRDFSSGGKWGDLLRWVPDHTCVAEKCGDALAAAALRPQELAATAAASNEIWASSSLINETAARGLLPINSLTFADIRGDSSPSIFPSIATRFNQHAQHLHNCIAAKCSSLAAAAPSMPRYGLSCECSLGTAPLRSFVEPTSCIPVECSAQLPAPSTAQGWVLKPTLCAARGVGDTCYLECHQALGAGKREYRCSPNGEWVPVDETIPFQCSNLLATRRAIVGLKYTLPVPADITTVADQSDDGAASCIHVDLLKNGRAVASLHGANGVALEIAPTLIEQASFIEMMYSLHFPENEPACKHVVALLKHGGLVRTLHIQGTAPGHVYNYTQRVRLVWWEPPVPNPAKHHVGIFGQHLEIPLEHQPTFQATHLGTLTFAAAPLATLPQGLAVDPNTGALHGHPTNDPLLRTPPSELVGWMHMQNENENDQSSGTGTPKEFAVMIMATSQSYPGNEFTACVANYTLSMADPLSAGSEVQLLTVDQPAVYITPSAFGGQGEKVFSVLDGQLLPGLKLDRLSGQIAGVPTSSAGFTFASLGVTDRMGTSVETAKVWFMSRPALQVSAVGLGAAGLIGTVAAMSEFDSRQSELQFAIASTMPAEDIWDFPELIWYTNSSKMQGTSRRARQVAIVGCVGIDDDVGFAAAAEAKLGFPFLNCASAAAHCSHSAFGPTIQLHCKCTCNNAINTTATATASTGGADAATTNEVVKIDINNTRTATLDTTSTQSTTTTPRPVFASAGVHLADLAAAGVYTFVYHATGLPDGMLMDPGTGALSGTPKEPGSYQILFSVEEANNRVSIAFDSTAKYILIVEDCDIWSSCNDSLVVYKKRRIWMLALLGSMFVAVAVAVIRGCHNYQRYIDEANHEVDFEPILEGLRKMSLSPSDGHDMPQEMPRKRVELQEIIGEGAFGEVYKASLKVQTGQYGWVPITIAAKVAKINESSNRGMPSSEGDDLEADFDEKEEAYLGLAREAALMAQFVHPNVIGLIGVCTRDLAKGKPFLMLVQYCQYGSLSHFIKFMVKQQAAKQLTVKEITTVGKLKIGYDVCLGMNYLTNMRYVHRDLAARNVLVDANLLCKVSDFGMSTNVIKRNPPSGGDLDEATPYSYYGEAGAPIPIRWSALEVLEKQAYSSASDVWSFGILMYEIFTDCQTPYEGMRHDQLVKKLKLGWRLGVPAVCTTRIYEQTMVCCWAASRRDRPGFSTLLGRLTALSQKYAARDYNKGRSGKRVQKSSLKRSAREQRNGDSAAQSRSNLNSSRVLAMPSAPLEQKASARFVETKMQHENEEPESAEDLFDDTSSSIILREVWSTGSATTAVLKAPRKSVSPSEYSAEHARESNAINSATMSSVGYLPATDETRFSEGADAEPTGGCSTSSIGGAIRRFASKLVGDSCTKASHDHASANNHKDNDSNAAARRMRTHSRDAAEAGQGSGASTSKYYQLEQQEPSMTNVTQQQRTSPTKEPGLRSGKGKSRLTSSAKDNRSFADDDWEDGWQEAEYSDPEDREVGAKYATSKERSLQKKSNMPRHTISAKKLAKAALVPKPDDEWMQETSFGPASPPAWSQSPSSAQGTSSVLPPISAVSTSVLQTPLATMAVSSPFLSASSSSAAMLSTPTLLPQQQQHAFLQQSGRVQQKHSNSPGSILRTVVNKEGLSFDEWEV